MLAETELDSILQKNFAPWVRDLGLVVVGAGRNSAVMRLPYRAEAAREGGAMCGQATAAAADTAGVLAVSAALGGYGPITTTHLTAVYTRPLECDGIVTAEVEGVLERRTHVSVTVVDAERGQTCAHGRATYYLPELPGNGASRS